MPNEVNEVYVLTHEYPCRAFRRDCLRAEGCTLCVANRPVERPQTSGVFGSVEAALEFQVAEEIAPIRTIEERDTNNRPLAWWYFLIGRSKPDRYCLARWRVDEV